ncbi:hypothetical protein JHK82_043175 [Glycine max]|nr:hypothetical protein JHK82_043175 [Glycine max]
MWSIIQAGPRTLRSSGPYGNSSNLDQEEATPWIQFPLQDPLEQDFCSNLLSELPPACEFESCKPIKQLEEDKFTNFFASNEEGFASNVQHNKEGLVLLVDAIEKAGYTSFGRFSSSHSSKSSVGGSMGSSEGFLAVLKTMWDNVGVEGAVYGRFQAGGEREERFQAGGEREERVQGF